MLDKVFLMVFLPVGAHKHVDISEQIWERLKKLGEIYEAAQPNLNVAIPLSYSIEKTKF
jgi:hypothetical protein